MFYPTELLSRQRRYKLAPCWLAALTNEKSFKKHYNSSAIKKINVIQTCEEIMRIIQSSNSRSERFTMYLSSHLMCGVTKILSYQTALYQKEIFEIQEKLESNALLKKKQDKKQRPSGREKDDEGFPSLLRDGVTAIDDFEPSAIELPLSGPNLLNAQLGVDLHLLSDDNLSNGLQRNMQAAAELNFGCLNDKNLALFGYNTIFDGNIESLMELLQNIGNEKDISEKMADVTITEEIHRERSQSLEIRSPVIVDISKINDKSKKELSMTPQKRQQREIQVETPTKKRRLSFETAPFPPVEDMPVLSPPVEDVPVLPPPAEDVAASAFELPIEETNTLVLPQQKELDMELEPLHSNYFVIKKHPKKSIIIDERITLSDKECQKWRQNIKICCKQSVDKPLVRKVSAKRLLELPLCLTTRHSRWNTKLHDLFVNHTIGPFTNDVYEDVAPAEFMQSQEVMRVEETNNELNLPTEDLSTFPKIDTAIAVEPIDSIIRELAMTNIAHETTEVPLMETVPDHTTITLGEDNSAVEHRQDKQKTTNISNINDEESFEDIEILLKRQRCSSKMKDTLEHSIPTNEDVPPSLTHHEIWALLEVLWHDKEYVKFSELIPEDTYTRDDAATAFNILLEFHAQKKLILQQAECYRTLWIRKYY